MTWLAHRLLLAVGLLAFVVSVPLAFGVPPAFAGEACPHEHDDGTPGMPHQHQHPAQPGHHHSDAACLCCCVGACMGIPDLARASQAVIFLSASPVFYAEEGVALSGRSLRPDPAPPRSIA